jgi:ribosome-associated translation inhibitor RaiA
METHINYGNMPKSPFLQSYLSEQMTRVHRYNLKGARAEMWLKSEGTIESRGQPLFSIKIKFKKPGHKEVFIKKTKEDFFEGFQHTLKALDKIIRRSK